MPIMPKKTTDNSAEMSYAKNTIQAYCDDAKISINKLSQDVGVSQSALYRFMNGERRTVTQAAKKTLSYVRRHNHGINREGDFFEFVAESEEYKIIENAVLSCWDGSRRSAELLAEVIKALRPIMTIASGVPRGKSEGGTL